MRLKEAKLDKYSKRIRNELLRVHPEWERYLRIETDGKQTRGYLYVEIPAPPSSNLYQTLYILTNNVEVTVGIDYYHSHFESMLGGADEPEWKKALLFIEDIMKEKISLVSWWQDEEWRGSSYILAGEKTEAGKNIRDFNRVRIRSWLGTYDRDIAA